MNEAATKKVPAPSEPDATEMELAKDGRNLVTVALGAVAFLTISAFSIRDWQLLSGTGIVKLPILDTEVPVPVFFFAAPILLLLLFSYVQVDVRRVVEEIEIGKHIPIWPFSEIPARKRGKGLSISVISNVIVWGAWPASSLLLAWRVLPLGHAWLGPLNLMSIAAAFAISLWNLHKVMVRRAKSHHTGAVVATVGLLLGGSIVTALICHRSLNTCDMPVHYTDFKSADIEGLELKDRDLRRANFTGAKLSQANLQRAQLERATFSGAELEYAEFCGAHLAGALLRNSKARSANFRCGTRAFVGAKDVDFTDADLRDVDFTSSTLRKLPRANLTGALLWAADLTKANLAGADLTRANLSRAAAVQAQLNEVHGTQTDFFRASMSKATFARAQLERPNFTATDLREANFAEAALKGAHLDGAQLEKANLEGCDLTDADITDATKLKGATYDKFTHLPAGLDPVARGMTKIGH